MKRKLSLFISLITIVVGSCSNLIIASPDAISVPQINAESAILIDSKSKTILYEKNAYEKHYPASITKLMTALLVIENLSPTNTITLSKEAVYSIERGSSHIGLDVDEQITVDQALHGLLLMSANEVANGLAEATSSSIENFALKMTDRAKELGAQNTHFVNPHGLHDEDHYTTAYDMSLITSYLSSNPYFLEIMGDITYQIPATNKTSEIRYLSQQHGLMNKQRNSKLYRPDVIAGKTGYTDIARHTLVTVAKEDDVELIVVILKSEKDTLYTDTNALLDYGFNAYRSLTLHNPNTALKTLPMYSIKSGQPYQAGNCSVSVQNPLSLLVRKDIKERDITTQISLPDYITIGATKGDVLGDISYLYNSKIIGTNKLVIKDIEFLPAPYATVSPEPNSFLRLLNYWWVVLVGILILIVLLFYLRKKRRHNRAKLKLDRLLK